MVEKILIIDDDRATVENVAAVLKKRGFEVIEAFCAQGGLRKAYSNQPDLVLLEVTLPDKDGWEMCRQLREMSDVPIIFLTARSDASDEAHGLNIGADDYLRKPWNDEVLIARINARLRRSPRAHLNGELSFNQGDFRINFMNREVWIRKSLKHLTPKEFNLLAVLVRNAGRVVSRTDLVTEAWGDEYVDAIDSLKLYIHYLRQKIETNPQQPEYILTSRGVGYRFVKR